MFAFLMILFAISFLIFMVLMFCLCVGCMGLTGTVTSMLTKILFSSTIDKVYSQDNQPINTECYICLENVNQEIVTTCNHSFCARCICDYITSNQGAIKCPACRLEIIVIYRRFKSTTTEQKALKRCISEYNHKYSKQPSFLRFLLELGSTIRNLPILLSVSGLRFIFNSNRIKYILLMCLYVISPFDLLPQMILGPVGLIDDSLVLINLLRQFGNLLREFVSHEINDRDE